MECKYPPIVMEIIQVCNFRIKKLLDSLSLPRSFASFLTKTCIYNLKFICNLKFSMLDIDFYSDFDSTWDGEGGVGSSDPSKGEKQLVRHFYHSLQHHHCYMSEHTHISRRPYFLKF